MIRASQDLPAATNRIHFSATRRGVTACLADSSRRSVAKTDDPEGNGDVAGLLRTAFETVGQRAGHGKVHYLRIVNKMLINKLVSYTEYFWGAAQR